MYQLAQQHELAARGPETTTEAPNAPALVRETGTSRPVSLRYIPRVLLNAWITPDSKAIGKLVIAKLNIDAVIRDGTDAQTLRRALGHMPSSALPGKTGNFVVTGHRDTFFRPLRNIRKGDDIMVVTPEGRYSYRVYSISVVAPDQVHVLDATSEPECTLVTCFPFDYVGRASRRFIVQGRLLGDVRGPQPQAAYESSGTARPSF